MAVSLRAAKSPYHHGNLPETLKRAALEEVAEFDLARLSLRRVARRAGVSPTAPYRHFESRDALLAAIAADGFRERTRLTRDAIRAFADKPLQRFLEAGVRYVLFAHERPAYYAIMTAPELSDTSPYPDLAEASAESGAILMAAIRDSQKAGLLHDGDARDIAAAAWASVHGLASLISTGQLKGLGYRLDDVEGLARRITGTLVSQISAA
jgi:AcrR family transcriptional regulator